MIQTNMCLRLSNLKFFSFRNLLMLLMAHKFCGLVQIVQSCLILDLNKGCEVTTKLQLEDASSVHNRMEGIRKTNGKRLV